MSLSEITLKNLKKVFNETATADPGYKSVDDREYKIESKDGKFVLKRKYFSTYKNFSWIPEVDKVFDTKEAAIKAGEDYIDNSY